MFPPPQPRERPATAQRPRRANKSQHKRGGRIMGLAKMHVVSSEFGPESGCAENAPAPRPEALRLLEAMLFASSEPLSEQELTERLPHGVDVRYALKELEKEYALRGVNLVRIDGKWTFRTAEDLAWLLRKDSEETR